MAKVKVRKIDNGKISREELLSRIGIERYNSLMESAATNNVALAIPEGLPQKIDESTTNEMLGQIAKVFGTAQETIKESFQDYEKAVRQTRLRNTWFGNFDYLDRRNENLNLLIRALYDKGIVKAKDVAYEDFLIEQSENITYDEAMEMIDEYSERWEELNDKSKRKLGKDLIDF